MTNEQLLRDALELACGHIDMNAVRISHCKDAEAIDEAIAATSQQAEGAPVGEVITIAQGRNAGKQVRLLRDLPNGTKLYAAPLPAQPQGQGAEARVVYCTPTEHEGRIVYEHTDEPIPMADSTNIGQNVGIDSAWRGTYTPPTKEARAAIMRERIESHQSQTFWIRQAAPIQEPLFAAAAIGEQKGKGM